MSDPKPSIPVSPLSQSAPDVPVFRCVVYIRKLESGQVEATVANLADLKIVAGSERSALMKIVPAFKQRVVAHKQKGEAIPLIDPPTPIEADQDQRVVPIHL